MSFNILVSLGSHDRKFIEDQISNRRYASMDDVLKAGLKLLEANEIKVNNLQNALIVGEKSGYSTSFDSDIFLQGIRKGYLK
ncbi:MAG: type II toxin-antitoxin system ParD family antitoxin [Alphaproteobacteria bacterium]|nr:type II toxin-antitoxin system ParD family antitoxin [Alphaproteobacteria bacterium]